MKLFQLSANSTNFSGEQIVSIKIEHDRVEVITRVPSSTMIGPMQAPDDVFMYVFIVRDGKLEQLCKTAGRHIRAYMVPERIEFDEEQSK